MKKIVIRSALFSIILLFSISAVKAESLKIGYINISKVFDNYKKTKVQNKKLEEMSSKKQKEREQIVADIKKMRKEMKMLSEKGKKKKRSSLKNKISELQKFDRETRSKLKMQRDDIMKLILDDIKEATRTYATKNNFDLILYKNTLLYSENKMDLTSKIINILNSNYKKEKK